jgi:hypothetical protein
MHGAPAMSEASDKPVPAKERAVCHVTHIHIPSVTGSERPAPSHIVVEWKVVSIS